MAFGTRLLGSGIAPQAANNIIGDVTQGAVALGTNQATALQAVAVGTEITSAASGTGIVGIPGNPGDMQWVYNGNTGQAVLWYPPSTDTVNNAATSYSIPVNTYVAFTKRNTTAWAANKTA